MRPLRLLLIALALGSVACSSADSGPGAHGDDRFAVGTQPLSLEPAPGGLCEGGGADKDCGPQGCAPSPASPPASGGSSAPGAACNGSAPASSGAALPMGSSSSGLPGGSAPPATPPQPTLPMTMAMAGSAASALPAAGSAADHACADG